MKKITFNVLVISLTVFALLTLFLSTSLILDLFDIRAKEGNYVLFVVWANLICSVLYLASAYGLAKMKTWTVKLLTIASVILIITLIAFYHHINSGGLYESKTVAALIFRMSVTFIFAGVAYFSINRKSG